MPCHPAGRARRGERPRQIRWQGTDEPDRARDLAHAPFEERPSLGPAALDKTVGQSANAPLDRIEKGLTGKPDIMIVAILDRGRVAEPGEQLGEKQIAL